MQRCFAITTITSFAEVYTHNGTSWQLVDSKATQNCCEHLPYRCEISCCMIKDKNSIDRDCSDSFKKSYMTALLDCDGLNQEIFEDLILGLVTELTFDKSHRKILNGQFGLK